MQELTFRQRGAREGRGLVKNLKMTSGEAITLKRTSNWEIRSRSIYSFAKHKVTFRQPRSEVIFDPVKIVLLVKCHPFWQ
jgi:hypothetical protein